MCSLEIKFRLRQLTGGFLEIDKIASAIILQILTELIGKQKYRKFGFLQ